MKWLSPETPPESGENVLVSDGKKVFEGYYYKTPDFEEWSNIYGEGVDVTAWMPLPPPVPYVRREKSLNWFW